MTAPILEHQPRGPNPAAAFITFLTSMTLAALVGLALRGQAQAVLWAPLGATLGGTAAAAAAAARSGSWADLEVTRDPVEWQLSPGSAYITPHSRCGIGPDGSVRLRAAPDDSLPFLFDVNNGTVPTRKAACSHCSSDRCSGPRLPHLCCGVCQFDGAVCDRLYPGEQRSAQVAAEFMAQGNRMQDFSPCELFQRIRGRTLWLMGDSQTWRFYSAVECFLREFAPSLQRSDPVPEEQMKTLATAQQGYCQKWWTVPPMCLQLVHNTRVCVVRADTATVMYQVALPTLQQHVPGFRDDLLVFNTGLHYFKDDGVCSNTTCEVPGPGSRYVTELEQLAAYREAHLRQLPSMVWMDTPPQHFPRTGYFAGEFHSEECVAWAAWQRGEAVPRAGGMWNVAAAPFVWRLADAHLRTWEASIPTWATHIPRECTHWCHPSTYHLWVYLLNRVLRDKQLPAGSSDVQVTVEPAAQHLQRKQPPR